MTPFKDFSLKDISFEGITFKDTQFPNEALADAFYNAGAGLDNYSVGEGESASRKQPRAQRTQAVAASVEKPALGDNSARALAQREAAALTAYARNVGGRRW